MTAQKFGEWLPIDTAPVGIPVLVIVAGFLPTSATKTATGEFQHDATVYGADRWPLTHWHPMIELPPKTSTNEPKE